MTEFARLLRDAAGQPPRPLKMDAIHHRAARRTLRRRVGLGLVGLGALAGIGAPAGLSVLPAGDRPADVETIGIDEGRHQPTPSTGLVEPRPSQETTPTSAVSARLDSTPIAPDIGSPASAPTSDGAPTADAATRPGFARASSCYVDNLFLRAGESKQCRFIAAAAGGWNVYQERGSTSPLESEIVTAVVYVTRDGVTTTYRTRKVETDSGARTEGCADDIIQAGDLVEIVLSETEDETPLDVSPDEGVAVGAGERWGCTDPGQPDWATSDEGST